MVSRGALESRLQLPLHSGGLVLVVLRDCPRWRGRIQMEVHRMAVQMSQ